MLGEDAYALCWLTSFQEKGVDLAGVGRWVERAFRAASSVRKGSLSRAEGSVGGVSRDHLITSLSLALENF